MPLLLTLLYALLMNVLPVAEALWHGRSPGAILFMYWFETCALLLTNSVRIVLHRRATGKTGHYCNLHGNKHAARHELLKSVRGANSFLAGYLGITVIFTIAHGVFVAGIVFLMKITGPVRWEDMQLAALWVIVVQLVFLIADVTRIGGWSFERLRRVISQSTMRVLVTQLGIIFGLMFAAATRSGWGLVFTFVALRTALDVLIHWLGTLMRREDLSPGLARWLSKRSKQPEAELQAEFDELKGDESAAIEFYERPVGEVMPIALRAQSRRDDKDKAKGKGKDKRRR